MPVPWAGALSDDARLTSACRIHTGLSREYRGLGRLKWHKGSPRHTWLGHHFQDQKVKVTRPLWLALLAGQHGHRVSNGSKCVYDVYRVTTCRPGRGYIVAASRLQLIVIIIIIIISSSSSSSTFPSVLGHCWLGDRKGIHSSLYKVWCWFVDGDDFTGALHV